MCITYFGEKDLFHSHHRDSLWPCGESHILGPTIVLGSSHESPNSYGGESPLDPYCCVYTTSKVEQAHAHSQSLLHGYHFFQSV